MRNNFQKLSLILSAVFFLAVAAVFVFLYQKINENNQKAETDAILSRTDAGGAQRVNSLESFPGTKCASDSFIPKPFYRKFQCGSFSGHSPKIGSNSRSKRSNRFG